MDISATQNAAQLSNIMSMRGSAQMDAAKNTVEAMGANGQFTPEKMARIDKAAQDFEAVFLSQMFSQMFNGIDVDPMFGGGKGEEMFRSMMVEEYGKKLADQGGIGIAESVKAKLIDMQAQQTEAQLNTQIQTEPK